MSIVLLRALILYILVIFSVRLMGKRQLGELQPSELVITILVSNIATLPLEDVNIPLMVGVTPILALVCFEVLMSWLSLKHMSVRKLVSGRPKIIISNGKIDRRVMSDLRFSVDDLMTSLRGKDVFRLEEVQYAIVETTGSVSVMKKPETESISRKDAKLKSDNIDPPQVIISDGRLLERAMRAVGMSMGALNKVLKEHSLSVEDVFIMMADSKGCCYIQGKNNVGGGGKQ
ncbi:MAG: DUF421 domain-containing protein [Ruminococcus sp.]|nr:DUF421 domain-containing protein [Ruminococcus sp.]